MDTPLAEVRLLVDTVQRLFGRLVAVIGEVVTALRAVEVKIGRQGRRIAELEAELARLKGQRGH